MGLPGYSLVRKNCSTPFFLSKNFTISCRICWKRRENVQRYVLWWLLSCAFACRAWMLIVFPTFHRWWSSISNRIENIEGVAGPLTDRGRKKSIDLDRDDLLIFVYLFQGNRGEQGIRVRTEAFKWPRLIFLYSRGHPEKKETKWVCVFNSDPCWMIDLS